MSSTTWLSETLDQLSHFNPEVSPMNELFLAKMFETDWVHNMLGSLNSTLAIKFAPWRLEMGFLRFQERGQRLVSGTHPVQAVSVDV